jgi:hypothetical protein
MTVGSGNVVNQMELACNDFGQVTADRQSVGWHCRLSLARNALQNWPCTSDLNS